MAEVTTASGGAPKRGVHRLSTRIDMTPMVDLAFLLITFFMLTTTFSRPGVMSLNMPVRDKPSPVPGSRTITILLDKHNRIFYYTGIQDPQVAQTDFSAGGIRRIIADQRRTQPKEPIFIIKALDQSRYENLVDVLDEMTITGATTYALVDVTPGDLDLLTRYKQTHGIKD
ncbi:MAG: Biopolymer transport protein ExbD/TolR [uncultured Cytophagales bacterium]|uniref:Biopolymer transport protein ExbD/TolR n=1 Tax=uncultured Cytophagales bacterium TaxID=158755 RepID=A0A6J4HNW2_9SPHI|nr:MAG: Biopolymer transport protein ExbD/TolR [uncultured Cytophagales bacterium]